MNQNIDEAYETSPMPRSSNTNDIIDLTEINDCDEFEETSSPAIASNNSVCPQPPKRPARNRRRTSTNSSEDGRRKGQSESKDDSICILYENVQKAPEVVFVNEVVIDGHEPNQSADIVSPSIPGLPVIPPIIMGSFAIDPIVQIPSLSPEISSERTSNPYRQNIYSMNNQIVTPQYSSLPSCRYASVTNEQPNSVPQPIPRQKSLLATQAQLNIPTKVPKIQCGICLDGPDEIAASDRNFTSTNCGHVFCNTCIKTSMRNAAKCPKCRKKITAKSIHPLYF